MAGKGAPVVIVKAEVDEEVKAAAAAGSSVGGMAPAAAAAAAAAGSSPSSAAATADSSAVAAACGGEVHEGHTKLVEMPESHIRWILAQEMRPVFTLDDYSVTTELYSQEYLDEKREHLSSIRESLLASQDDFATYQARIREEYEREGRVMVPAPINEAQKELNRLSLQEEIDRLFAQGVEEFERDHPDLVKLIAEVEAKTEAELLGVETDSKTGDIIASTAYSNCS